MSADRCDREIFERGTVIAIFQMPKVAMEALVAKVRGYLPNVRIDWHYAGGRALVKALGETIAVAAAHQSFASVYLGTDAEIAAGSARCGYGDDRAAGWHHGHSQTGKRVMNFRIIGCAG